MTVELYVSRRITSGRYCLRADCSCTEDHQSHQRHRCPSDHGHGSYHGGRGNGKPSSGSLDALAVAAAADQVEVDAASGVAARRRGFSATAHDRAVLFAAVGAVEGGHSAFLAFFQRAWTALRAISLRCSAVRFRLRATPPFRPSATACGSLRFAFAMAAECHIDSGKYNPLDSFMALSMMWATETSRRRCENIARRPLTKPTHRRCEHG